MEAKRKAAAAQSHSKEEKDEKRLSFFDVDARAELRSVPASAVWFPPRLGEKIELRADVEYGGGLYVVVGVRHVLEDIGPVSDQLSAVVRVIVEVKPQHSARTEAAEAAAEELITLDEVVTIPAVPLPITVEMSDLPEAEA